MDEILKEKEKLKQSKKKYLLKISQIDNDLLIIEKKLSKCSNEEIDNILPLSIKQQQVVDAREDNILVISVAGSGKTHVIITRYVNLILKHNVTPESVLLITFTKKAGNEMLDRLQNIIPSKLPFHTGSLHGLVYRILQKYTNINPTILSEKDLLEMLVIETRKELQEINISENIKKIIETNIFIIIDQASITFPVNFKLILKKYNLSKYNNLIIQIHKRINKRKKTENIMDFNDLLIAFCNFLKTSKSIDFKNQIKYIFFDEFQDINPIQNYILTILANTSKLMCVGDDSQAIYSFRGATISCILDFNKNFTTSSKYILEENYRSTPSIIHFCNDIINKNVMQYKKTVKPIQKEVGDKPNILGFNSNDEQYKWVFNDIIDKINNGTKLSEIVILARNKKSINKIEMLFISQKIPIVKLSGLAILEKDYIKDILGFIIIIINPKSTIHWKRILKLHKHLDKIDEIVEKSSNMLNTLKDLSLVHNDINIFVNIITNISNHNSSTEKIKIIINYLEKLWIEKKINYNKYDINLLLSLIKKSTLEQFICELQLDQDIEIIYDDAISLSTIHGSKGLEWKNVYIIDVNSNELPNLWSKYDYFIDEINNIEEERRLFYVAASRAKKYLTITYNSNMSPFIKELNFNLYIPNNITLLHLQTINSHIINYVSRKNNTYMNNLCELNIKEKIIHDEINIRFPNHFLNNLVYKMIHNNYYDKIIGFEINSESSNILEYKKQKHWSTLLDIILTLESKNKSDSIIKTESNILANDAILIYKNIELGIIKLIDICFLNSENLYINYKIPNFDKFKESIDLLFDDIIVDVKATSTESCTLSNLSRLLFYGYELKKKNIHINKIIFYNIYNGLIKIIDTTTFNFDLYYKDNINLYNNIK